MFFKFIILYNSIGDVNITKEYNPNEEKEFIKKENGTVLSRNKR